MNLFASDEFSKKYKVSRTLGTGSFATVKVCTKRDDKDRVLAVKIMNRQSMKNEDQVALENEISIMGSLDHPNIVKLHETYKSKKHVYLVMELMTGGEMFDRIVEKTSYDENTARRDLSKILGALSYCHKSHVVHRDLKPENLLYADKTDDSEVKIADFGLAQMVQDEPFMKTACGTPGYVAPEVLTENANYDSKVDVWSMGVITYIVLCGFPPFYHTSNSELFRLIRRGKFEFPSPYWDNISDDAKDLVRFMLQVEPAKRPSIDQVLMHKWFTGDTNCDLSGSLIRLKEYNASRKFRNAVTGVQALQRMRISVSAMAGKRGSKDAGVPGTVPEDPTIVREGPTIHDPVAEPTA